MGRDEQGLKRGDRYQTILRVLVFLRNGSDVLLLQGARNKRIWAGLYNGVGGHVEADEDIFSAAVREVGEETGLSVERLELKAVVNIDVGDEQLGILMFAFEGWVANRETVSSAEGALHWVPVDQVHKQNLVEDLYWLLPRLLSAPNGSGPMYLHYSYDESDKLVIRRSPGGDSAG
jgi:8-oxo-dGTP diphosphatase